MTALSPKQLLNQLTRLKQSFNRRSADRVLTLLALGPRVRFTDAAVLAQYHETLLFIRAHPYDRRIVAAAERALKAVPMEIARLATTDADLSPLDEADLSGIFGRSVTGVFSFPVASWLAQKHHREIEIDWDGYEDEARLAQTLPRLIPLLDDETLVEAHFPYLDWLSAASGAPEKALPWLIDGIQALPISFAEKAEIYDSLRLYLRWTSSKYRSSRTGMRLATSKPFYHMGPMLARRDVSLAAVMDGPPLPTHHLPADEGAALLESIRQTSTQRYRELHGFSYGDPTSFIRYDAGRGMEIYVNEVTPDHRLPLRAYHSAFMVKNGVPAGYVEGLSLFDRMELGFNIYYTFRDGESAYLYARVMQIFHQTLGINCFSVDPYQIGHENEEGLESGAFWFYRKLGFQPARADLLKLVRQEEKKIAAKAGYRTSIEVLKQIAKGHVFYDRVDAKVRDWSKFQIRNLGLAAARRMKKDQWGDSVTFRAVAENEVACALSAVPYRWPPLELDAFRAWSPVLALVPNLADWSKTEKAQIVAAIRAKGARTEAEYLKLLQADTRLGDAVLTIGSKES